MSCGRSAAVAKGRGLAYVHDKPAETIVATAMDVEVERASGRIRVSRVVCAQDCGLAINPDNVRSQVEGNILQTLSRTLHEDAASTPGPAALSNAVFDATGVRLRDVPFRPDRVKAALARAR
jgi:nicotinate dehydrogenase subunit B